MKNDTSQIDQDLQTLGLPPDASLEAVEEAYQELAVKWDPDRLPDLPGLKHRSQQKLREIEAAVDSIRDWHTRQASAPGSLLRPDSSPSLYDDIFSGRSDGNRKHPTSRTALIVGAAFLLLLLLFLFWPGSTPPAARSADSAAGLPTDPTDPAADAASGPEAPTNLQSTPSGDSQPATTPPPPQVQSPTQEPSPAQKGSSRPGGKPRLVRPPA